MEFVFVRKVNSVIPMHEIMLTVNTWLSLFLLHILLMRRWQTGHVVYMPCLLGMLLKDTPWANSVPIEKKGVTVVHKSILYVCIIKRICFTYGLHRFVSSIDKCMRLILNISLNVSFNNGRLLMRGSYS